MSLVETAVEGRVATITLNRPELRNALSIELCDAIVDAVGLVESDPDTRVVVMRGAGRAFCAGADFAAVSGPKALEFLPSFERMLETVARCRLPVIAAIHGAALGGGLQLATVCDFRIASEEARFGIPSPRLGIVVNFENVERLVMLAGIAVAKEFLMTDRTFSATEARAAGLVNRSEAASNLDSEVARLADDIAGLAPLSVQGAKRAVQVVTDNIGQARATSASEVAQIDELVTTAYESADLAEGIRAMTEKRPPNFEGR